MSAKTPGSGARPPAEGQQNRAWENEADGIYRHLKSNGLYERPYIDGRRAWRSLGTSNLKLAREELIRRKSAIQRGENPYALARPVVAIRIGEAIARYQKDNYPDRQRQPRPALMRDAEEENCCRLLEFWRNIRIDDMSIAACDQYHDWRVKHVTRGPGHRTVDLELNTLRNAFLWACRCAIIKYMPLTGTWPRYRPDKSIRHCREFAPHDATELHKVARMLFGHGKSAVLAWQALVEGATGLRTIEVLGLRTDAKPYEPGWRTLDGKSLCVRRAKGQESVNPFVSVHDGLNMILEELHKWKAVNYPDSPWYFPSPYDKTQPVDKSALCKALCRLRPRIGRKITSHGLRSFYVTIRRSHGISDVQIAYEIGHTSGGSTLGEVYGGCPPHWLAGDGPKLTWLPEGQPAWSSTIACKSAAA